MLTDDITTPASEPMLREAAVQRLKKKRDLFAHLLVYTLFNASFVVIWALTGSHGFFWPVFLIVFWGIGVVMNAYDVYRRDQFSEASIRREMSRLR
jgi:predicted membrane channel-forming protein YqfA (hemolysin III family)